MYLHKVECPKTLMLFDRNMILLKNTCVGPFSRNINLQVTKEKLGTCMCFCLSRFFQARARGIESTREKMFSGEKINFTEVCWIFILYLINYNK